MSELVNVRREPTGEAEGLLVLHHGRGSNEHDLIGFADVLDPERRLLVVSPGGPLTLPGWPGRHWYAVQRVGFPDRATFERAFDSLCRFHDSLWEETGIGPQRTVLGGFSMGSVMSFATGLGPGRPAPAGILGISGFIATVEGWQPDFAGRPDTRVLIAHGRNDPVIPIGFAHSARDLVEAGGLELEYLESDAAHHVDASQVPAIAGWLAETLGT
ncbi:MAG: phospholipase [Planctomycetia bacterium]|nr:phospholipase [Planctomycetia bacterium]